METGRTQKKAEVENRNRKYYSPDGRLTSRAGNAASAPASEKNVRIKEVKSVKFDQL